MKDSRLFYFLLMLVMLIGEAVHAQSNSDFVRIEGNNFKLGNDPFFPVVANYGITVYKIVHNVTHTTTFHATPQFHQFGRAIKVDTSEPISQGNYLSIDEKWRAMVEDFKLLIDHGFNAIRLTYCVQEEKLYESPCNSFFDPIRYGNCLGFYCSSELNPGGFWCDFEPITSGSYSGIFSIYDQVIDAVNAASSDKGKPLKIIILAGGRNIDQPHRKDDFVEYLEALAFYFKDQPEIMGYDFINEPGTYRNTGVVEDSLGVVLSYVNYSKRYVCELVDSWHSAIKKNSNHLTTIGLSGYSDVLEWDPGIMNLDFLSFHVYGSEKFTNGTSITNSSNPNLQKVISHFKSQVSWISKNINKPWIIGETGLSCPINNEFLPCEGSDEDQRVYAEKTLAFTRDAGGKGYSWWHCRDTHDNLHPSSSDNPGNKAYYGLWTTGLPTGMIPECPNDEGLYDITDGHCKIARKKPAANEFFDFNPFSVSPSNGVINEETYYNPFGYENFINGEVNDTDSNPIPNAIVIGRWCVDDTDYTYYTFTKNDGTFQLYHDQASGLQSVTVSGINYDIKSKSSGPFSFILTGIRYDESLSGIISNNVKMEATNEIQAYSATLVGNGVTGVKCELIAGKAIKFLPNFLASKGSTLIARIGNVDCASVPDDTGGPENYLKVKSIHSNDIWDIKASEETIIDTLKHSYDILEFSYSINPNPNSGSFNINTNDMSGKKKWLSIYTSTGSLVTSFFTSDKDIFVALPVSKNGLYFLTITVDGITKYNRIIVARP